MVRVLKISNSVGMNYRQQGRALEKILSFLCLATLLVACGGGGSASSSSVEPSLNATPTVISDKGFVDNGIFFGNLNGTEVLLLLDQSNYFLLYGTFSSQGTFNRVSVELTGSGVGYDLGEDSELIGNVEVRGTYKTDRHLDFTWLQTDTGIERNLVVEATLLYFEPSPLERILGSWINQDEGNITFFTFSDNSPPIAADDYLSVALNSTTPIPVLANDRDPDGDPLSISAFDFTSLKGGVITNDDAGTPDDGSDDFLLYLAPTGMPSGVDSFSYTVSSGVDANDTAQVKLSFGVRDVDLSIEVDVDNLSPMVGDLIKLTGSVSNPSADAVITQVQWSIPDGLGYRGFEGDGSFDAKTEMWLVTVAPGKAASMIISAGVKTYGNFDLEVRVSALDGVDDYLINNQAELVLTPVGLSPIPDFIPRTASVDGVILSSLSQITGTIQESVNQRNAYPITLEIGGGLSAGGTKPPAYTGYAIINQELVDVAANPEADPPTPATEELRDSMLILTTNGEGVYLNKVYFVSQEELSSGSDT